MACHDGVTRLQDARQATAAAAAAAVVREAYASATLDALEGESEEEKQAKLTAAKESKMRKVIRWFTFYSCSGSTHTCSIAMCG